KKNFQELPEGFLLLFKLTAVFDADGRGKTECVHGFLHSSHAAAKVRSFEASGNRNKALQIFAPNFGFTRSLADGGKCAECGGLAGAANEQRVVHALERGAIFLRKADADGIGTVVTHDGRSSGRTFQNRECV